MSYIIFAALGWCIDFLTTHGMPFLGPSEVMLNNSVSHQHPMHMFMFTAYTCARFCVGNGELGRR